MKTIHVVGDRGDFAVLSRTVVVPARPGAPERREHALVGVQHRRVRLVSEGAEDRVFRRRRVTQESESLIAVGRDDDVIEPLGPAPGDVELDLMVAANDLLDRRSGAQPRAQRPNDRIHISSGAAGDGAPRQRTSQAKEPVVVEEPGERLGGVASERRRIGRPDRRAERDEVPVDELRRPAAVGQQILE